MKQTSLTKTTLFYIFLWALLVVFLLLCEKTEACNAYEKITELVYFEARGEPFEGQLAVATVAINRLYSGKYGETLCDVIEAKKQFSYYWDGVAEVMDDPRAKAEAEEVAECIVRAGCVFALIRGATHYYACKGSYGIDPPYWTRYYTLIAEVGNHCFYQEENING